MPVLSGDASELARALAGEYASLLGPAPRPRADVDAALDAARKRLGVAVAAVRRDGLPREQTTLDLRS